MLLLCLGLYASQVSAQGATEEPAAEDTGDGKESTKKAEVGKAGDAAPIESTAPPAIFTAAKQGRLKNQPELPAY